MVRPDELVWEVMRTKRWASRLMSDIFTVGPRYIVALYVDTELAEHIAEVHNAWLKLRKEVEAVGDQFAMGSGKDGRKAVRGHSAAGVHTCEGAPACGDED